MEPHQEKTDLLIAKFPDAIRTFCQNPPFTRSGQLEFHLRTIAMRRSLQSAEAAVQNDGFIESLHDTLGAWGIGSRASKIRPLSVFADAIRKKSSEIIALGTLTIDDSCQDANSVANALWNLIDSLNIVENASPVVAGTKALHHILPDLVVPVDRAYTQRFFEWHNPQFQYGQEKCFKQAYKSFSNIAKAIDTKTYLDRGWNSSKTKIIDNAIVGFVLSTK